MFVAAGGDNIRRKQLFSCAKRHDITQMYPQFIGFSQSTISGISVLPKKRQLGVVIQAIEPV